LGTGQAGIFSPYKVSGGGNEDNFEDVGILRNPERATQTTGGVDISFNLIFWGKEDIDKYGFGVGFPHDPLEDFLGLVDIEGGNLIGNSGEGLKFLSEGVV